jgi:hypothetical protein
MPTDTVHRAVGIVVDILQGHGLAHVMTDEEKLLGIRRVTPGVDFNELRIGDHVEVEFLQPFSRVLRARIVSLGTSPRE